MTDLADAVREKSGETGKLSIAGLTKAVKGLSSGGVSLPIDPHMVNFIDFDGAVVERWSLESLSERTELPSLPSHPGLTAQGWNWTLSDIKAFGEANIVGQNYMTDDGKTRIYISLSVMTNISISLECGIGTVLVDWGDGSEEMVCTEPVEYGQSHKYPSPGDYVVTIDSTAGNVSLRWLGFSEITESGYARPAITKIEIGENFSLLGEALRYCRYLETVTVPKGLRKFGSNLFSNCSALKAFVLPDGVTEIEEHVFYKCERIRAVSLPASMVSVGYAAFSECRSLELMAFPISVTAISGYVCANCTSLRRVVTGNDNITSLGHNLFFYDYSLEEINLPEKLEKVPMYLVGNCWNLKTLILPASITSIDRNVFGNCYGLRHLYLRPQTPPTAVSGMLDQSEALTIHVPKGCGEAYRTAEYWSEYADRIEEEI